MLTSVLKTVILLFISTPINLLCWGSPSVTLSGPTDYVSTDLQDTLLFDKGLYLVYEYLEDENYLLKWGIVDSFENIAQDTFRVLPSGRLTIRDYNHQAMYLTQGCGTGCSYACVLPLYPNATSKQYFEEPISYNLVHELVVYTPGRVKGYWFIVENYRTGKSLNIVKDVFCPSYTPTTCVQEAYFSNHQFIISYTSLENQEIVTKKIDISELSSLGIQEN